MTAAVAGPGQRADPVLRFAAVPSCETSTCATGDPASPWLTAMEIARRDRLRRPEDRAAYEAAHRLVRICAAELLGRDPAELELVQRCAACGAADHGAPAIRGEAVRVSLSHTRGFVAAIASADPCGVDVERGGGAIPDRVLHPAERAWLRAQRDPEGAFTGLWARKEALVKAGLGALDGLVLIDARHPGPGVELGDWRGDGACGAWCVVRSPNPAHT